MALISALDIGSFYQNLAFYTFLALLMCINLDTFKQKNKQKSFNAPLSNR
ncbi:MAG: hypothetical protein JWP37_4358 [Mucilaginibacter sp.]|nr:hypothetical protein [Mucilaginibacter sp.]